MSGVIGITLALKAISDKDYACSENLECLITATPLIIELYIRYEQFQSRAGDV